MGDLKMNENNANKALMLHRASMVSRANALAESKNWEMLNARFFPNEADDYLMFITFKRLDPTINTERPYATILFNNNSETGFFVEGHYDFVTEEAATADMIKRR